MGEIANDIVNGKQCSWCGICFEQEHGFPVVCKGCGSDDDYDPKTDPPIATKEEF